MIAAQLELTQALKQQRQFVGRMGSSHNLILDDAAGGYRSETDRDGGGGFGRIYLSGVGPFPHGW